MNIKEIKTGKMAKKVMFISEIEKHFTDLIYTCYCEIILDFNPICKWVRLITPFHKLFSSFKMKIDNIFCV